MPKPSVALVHRNVSFGFNRRQKPMRICCPGGEVVLTRYFKGTVRVEVVPSWSVLEPVPAPGGAIVLNLEQQEDAREAES